MSVSLLGTHLRLLTSDLDTLAESPELGREALEFAGMREALTTARRAAEQLQLALALPVDRSPGLPGSDE